MKKYKILSIHYCTFSLYNLIFIPSSNKISPHEIKKLCSILILFLKEKRKNSQFSRQSNIFRKQNWSRSKLLKYSITYLQSVRLKLQRSLKVKNDATWKIPRNAATVERNREMHEAARNIQWERKGSVSAS